MAWVTTVFEEHCTPKPKKPKLEDFSKTDTVEKILPNSKSIIKLDTWLSRHKPKQIEDLVVNCKKIEELKTWLKYAISDGNSSKILLITGPPGSGKTVTLQVICNSLNLQVIEWITPLDMCFQQEGFNGDIYNTWQNPSQVFKDFLLRAIKYNNILNSFTNSYSKIVLVKDYPNIFINKPSTFHDVLNDLGINQSKTPLIFISSDGALCRNLFTNELKSNCKISTINFNPIVHLSIVKVLQRIVEKEKKIQSSITLPSKSAVADISSCCDGDLRSAILKLYFNTFGVGVKSVQNKNQGPRDKKGKLLNITLDMDKKLDIFHGLGRVLYPKKEDLVAESKNQLKKSSFKFTHPPGEIIDMYSTQRKIFVEFLQENYLNTFTNINDVSFGADKLAIADLLLSHWKEKESSQQYGLSVAVQGLMVANKVPLRAWNPMSKSNTYKTTKEYKNHALRIRQTFPEFQTTPRDSFLDIVPFLKTIQCHKELEQLSFIKEYSLK